MYGTVSKAVAISLSYNDTKKKKSESPHPHLSNMPMLVNSRQTDAWKVMDKTVQMVSFLAVGNVFVPSVSIAPNQQRLQKGITEMKCS